MIDVSRLVAGLAAIVRGLTSRVDYLAIYRARVVSQNEDGTLELRPDDPRVPPASRVPIHYGVPGVRATVAAGAFVDLGFQGGSPEAPIAELWESASVTTITIETTAQVLVKSPRVILGDEGDARPIARVGDPVVGLLSAGSTIVGTSPVVGAFTAVIAPASPIYGIIQSGAQKSSAA